MDDRSLTWLLDHTLPLNRKERFYTGTVLPGIACANLAELRRLTDLMGYPDVEVSDDPADPGLLFFTEYGIAESAFGPAAQRLEGLSTARDTPDVVFLTTRPTPVLFAVEAKMFDRPGGGALREQLDVQRSLLEPLAGRLATWLKVEDVPVVHYALLPERQAATIQVRPYDVITWEQVHHVYADIAPPYWLQMLTEALDRYDDLVTRAMPNDDARLSGQEIVDGHAAGTLTFTAVGRSGGLDGPRLREDLASGTWRTTLYQAAVRHPGNRNWFTVEEFVQRATPMEALELDTPEAHEEAVAELRSRMANSTAIGMRVYGEGSVADQIVNAPDAALRHVPTGELRRVAGLYRDAAEAARRAREEASDILTAVLRHDELEQRAD